MMDDGTDRAPRTGTARPRPDGTAGDAAAEKGPTDSTAPEAPTGAAGPGGPVEETAEERIARIVRQFSIRG